MTAHRAIAIAACSLNYRKDPYIASLKSISTRAKNIVMARESAYLRWIQPTICLICIASIFSTARYAILATLFLLYIGSRIRGGGGGGGQGGTHPQISASDHVTPLVKDKEINLFIKKAKSGKLVQISPKTHLLVST